MVYKVIMLHRSIKRSPVRGYFFCWAAAGHPLLGTIFPPPSLPNGHYVELKKCSNQPTCVKQKPINPSLESELTVSRCL